MEDQAQVGCGSLLSKSEILQLAKFDQLVTRFDGKDVPAEQFQPACVDITVGSIYVPPAPGDDFKGEVIQHVDTMLLHPGSMVLVQSAENINLGVKLKLGAYVFPKNGDFALKGLLFTNFGQIDPGFDDRLKFTVINMGRNPCHLKAGGRGDRIAGVSFFKLSSETSKYEPRNGGSPIESHAKNLSRDFLDVENRVVRKITEHERYRDVKTLASAFASAFAGATIAVVIGFLGMAASYVLATSPIYDKFNTQNVEILRLQNQIESLKASLTQIKDKLPR